MNNQETKTIPEWKRLGYESQGQYEKWGAPFDCGGADDQFLKDIKAGKYEMQANMPPEEVDRLIIAEDLEELIKEFKEK